MRFKWFKLHKKEVWQNVLNKEKLENNPFLFVLQNYAAMKMVGPFGPVKSKE